MGWPSWAADELKRINKAHPPPAFPPIPGLADSLQGYHLRNTILAILTSRDRESLERRLAEAGINKDLFEIIQGLNDSEFTKPDPRVFDQMIDEYLAPLGISISEILFVGDIIISDWDAARNHNPQIPFVGITGGDRGVVSREEFVAAGVPEEFILETAVELPRLIDSLEWD